MASIEEFKQWLERDLSRFAGGADHVEIVNVVASASPRGDEEIRLRIYTDVHSYCISARIPKMALSSEPGVQSGTATDWSTNPCVASMDNGYLGCIASSRKPRAGEDWARGNDLADGPLTEETWRRILADIVSYEMVRAQLAESTAAPLDKMREWQGTIAGLKLAAGKLDDRYRENR